MRHVTPSESDMKACPMASTTPFQPKSSKSTSKRNSIPSSESGNNNELTQNTMSNRKSNGIMKLAMRSIPFSTPRLSTRKLRIKKSKVHITQRQGELTKVEKMLLYSSGVCPNKLPLAELHKYSITHPHTTQ